MNHVGASVVRIHPVHIRAPIHTDGAEHVHTHTRVHARPRNDENTRPSSLVVRPCVKYCLLLLLIVSTSFIPAWRERRQMSESFCLFLSLSPLSLFLLPFFIRAYSRACICRRAAQKCPSNCTSVHKRRLSPIVFTETAFPLRTHRVSKPQCRSCYMTPFSLPQCLSILMPPRSSRIKLATIFLSASNE